MQHHEHPNDSLDDRRQDSPTEFDDEGTLVVERHFAIVPEWIIDAKISDAAYRLYSVLLRYGQSSGRRMPSRALLARRLRKRSVDSVDRALKELVAIGAVAVERRRRGREYLSNRYHLLTTPPTAPTPLGGQEPRPRGDPGGLFATRRVGCSLWPVLMVMIFPVVGPSPLRAGRRMGMSCPCSLSPGRSRIR